MKEIRADNCPNCRADFGTILFRHNRVEALRAGSVIETLEDNTITSIVCDNGHTFKLLMRASQSPRFTVIVPTVVGGSPMELHTDEPCVGCHKDIQPGQIYSGGAKKPRHIGC